MKMRNTLNQSLCHTTLLLMFCLCFAVGCTPSTYDPTQDLINGLDSDDPAKRRRAAFDIGEMHHLPEEFVERLLKLAENDPESYVRSAAAEGLRHAGPSVRSKLRKIAENESDDAVRRTMIDIAEQDGAA